jgi:WD40 repeat protein
LCLPHPFLISKLRLWRLADGSTERLSSVGSHFALTALAAVRGAVLFGDENAHVTALDVETRGGVWRSEPLGLAVRAMSTNGDMFVIGNDDATVRIFDSRGWNLVRTLDAAGPITSVAFVFLMRMTQAAGCLVTTSPTEGLRLQKS